MLHYLPGILHRHTFWFRLTLHLRTRSPHYLLQPLRRIHNILLRVTRSKRYQLSQPQQRNTTYAPHETPHNDPQHAMSAYLIVVRIRPIPRTRARGDGRIVSVSRGRGGDGQIIELNVSGLLRRRPRGRVTHTLAASNLASRCPSFLASYY